MLGLFMLAAAVAGRAVFSTVALSSGVFTFVFVVVAGVLARRFLLAPPRRHTTAYPPVSVDLISPGAS